MTQISAVELQILKEKFEGQPIRVIEQHGANLRTSDTVCKQIHDLRDGGIALEGTGRDEWFHFFVENVGEVWFEGRHLKQREISYRVELRAVAWICPRGTVALIREPGGEVFLVDSAGNVTPGQQGFYERYYFRLNLDSYEAIHADEYPYPLVQKQVNLYNLRSTALQMLVTAVMPDPDGSHRVRADSAQFAEKLLADAEVFAWVEKKFLSKPMPPSAVVGHLPSCVPADGRVMSIITAARKKW